jgi:hypothetical protein
MANHSVKLLVFKNDDRDMIKVKDNDCEVGVTTGVTFGTRFSMGESVRAEVGEANQPIIQDRVRKETERTVR